MLPLVSVIVPVRNEERFIDRCIGAILGQDYPADRFEVIVADGMSSDRTRAIIASLPGAARIRVLDNPNLLQAPGLNLCIEQARGDVIIRVDGHTLIAPDYIAQCVTSLNATGAWNVGGAITHVGETETGRAIAAAAMSSFGVPGAFHGSPRPQFSDTVYMGAWFRWVFEQVGGFAPGLAVNEDYELNWRIRAAGGTIYYNPAIRCEYFGRQTLRELFRQYFRYGQGKVKVLAQHPRSLKWRQAVPPAFLAALVAGPILTAVERRVDVVWLVIIVTYAATNLIYSIRAAAHGGWSLLPRVAAVFLVIHLSWGSGFWYGLVLRVVRRRPRSS